MSWMFGDCNNLESIIFGTNFNTSQLTNMKDMFNGCESLTNLDLSKFDTSKVTDMSSMFSFCGKIVITRYTKLKHLKLKTRLFDQLSKGETTLEETQNYLYDKNNNLKNYDDIVVTGDYYLSGGDKKYITIVGDTDGDGDIKLIDIMKLANYLYKDKSSLSGVYLEAGDYNLDKTYTLVDIMQMSNYLYKGGK